jgi:hypothetical protein
MHAASAPLPLAAGLIPDAQLEWLDDVAHLPHLEGDSVTLDVIADFVDSLAGGGERFAPSTVASRGYPLAPTGMSSDKISFVEPQA